MKLLFLFTLLVLTLAQTAHAVTLQWTYQQDPAVPAILFRIYKASCTTGVYTIVQTQDVAVVQWVDSSVQMYQKPYSCYYVTAVDAVGTESDKSNIASNGKASSPTGLIVKP